MKWSEAKIKSGDLIAVSHQEWSTVSDIESQIVRIVCESEYSHVCVALVEGEGDVLVIEAVVPAVTVSPIEKYLKDGFYWIATPDKPMSDDELKYGMSKVGQAYSKWEAIEGDLDLLKISADEFWQCSELTIAMRRFSQLDLGPKATPAAVVQAALNQGYTLQYIKEG